MVIQLASWYVTPPVVMEGRFMATLEAELRGFINRSWNYKRTLLFANVVLTNTLGIYQARDIRATLTQRIDLWERGLHAGLVRNVEMEWLTREYRDAR